jgi:hypothetical protein
VTPPPASLRTHLPGGDTRERKIFIFNVRYTSSVDGLQKVMNQSLSLPLNYSITPVLYLLCGLLGALIGNIIKSFSAQKKDKASSRQALRAVFTEDIGGMCTSLAIAFVVLLVLSRDAIPAKGWYDSLALGAAVGILSDDQLLMKTKQVIPGAG